MGSTGSRRILGVLAVGGVLLLSTACGNGDTTTAGPDKSAAADPMASFRACLEKQGVTLPNGGPAAGGTPPSAPPTRPTDAPSTHPTDAPTTHPGAPGPGRPTNAPTQRPTRSAAEQKAMQTCASLAPQRRNGPGGAPPSGLPQENNTP